MFAFANDVSNDETEGGVTRGSLHLKIRVCFKACVSSLEEICLSRTTMLDRAYTTSTRLCMHGTGHLIYSGVAQVL